MTSTKINTRQGDSAPILRRDRCDTPSAQMGIGMHKIGMTVEEAAVYTGIGRNTLRQLVGLGKIPALRIGRKAIIRTEALDRFMQINQGLDLLDSNQVLPVN